MQASRESLGIGLTVAGGLLLVVAGLWFLDVLSLPAVPSPGVLLPGIGGAGLSVGAYVLTRVESDSA